MVTQDEWEKCLKFQGTQDEWQCTILMGSLKNARAQTRILKHEIAESASATGAQKSITGWCPTLTLLLICSSLSGENGHPMQIYS